jgi:uncharacterized protein with WD repeat
MDFAHSHFFARPSVLQYFAQGSFTVMPHTTTKAHRSKRPDYRPNEKVRRALQKKIEDSKTIQNIRVTSVQKREKKERVAQPTQLSTLSKNEKILRALRKKLNGINVLLEKEQSGVELDEQQLSKVASLKSVMDEMEELMRRSRHGNNNGESDEDEKVE